VRIKEDALRSVLRVVLPAAAGKKEKRDWMRSVCVTRRGFTLSLACTDETRLHLVEIASVEDEPDFSVLLHSESLARFVKPRRGTAGTCQVTDRGIIAEGVTHGSVVDQRYPDYRQVIPPTYSTLTLSATALADCAAAIAACRERLTATWRDGAYALTSEGDTGGDITCTIACPEARSRSCAQTFDAALFASVASVHTGLVHATQSADELDALALVSAGASYRLTTVIMPKAPPDRD
jgi:hypothetical protein